MRTIVFAADDLPDFFAIVEDGVDPVEGDGAVWGWGVVGCLEDLEEILV